jgi:ABC-type branched-subunit amino acid transport system substrate-binding protein
VSNSPLAQLLDLCDSKASGEFVCEGEGAEVHVYLQVGRVAWATDSQHPFAFKHRLKEQANLDEGTYQEVMAECRRTHAPVGETLVGWKVATLEQVRDALSDQIGPALEMLGKCAGGAKAVFLPRPQYAQYNLDLTFDPRALLVPADVELPASSAPTPPAPPAADPSQPPTLPGALSAPPVPSAAASAPAGGRGLSHRFLIGAAAAIVLASVAIASVLKLSRPSEARTQGTPARAGASKADASSAEAAEAVASASSGVSETEVVFGMSSAFSGANKELGREMRKGFELAFAVANEAGGVHGRKLRLVALDDGYEPARTLQVMQDLVENRKVFAIVGNLGASTAAVSLPYVLEKKVVFFGALTGSPLLRKRPPDRYVFNYRPSYAEETEAAVRYLVEVRRIAPSQIAVFYQDDEFGHAGLAGVEEQLRKEGFDPAQMVRMTYRRNSADISGAIETVKKEAARLRAVVMVATYQAAIQFIEQTRDLGVAPAFTNVSTVDSNALAEGLIGAGKTYSADVVVTQIVPHPNAKSTAALECQSAMEKHAGGEAPGFVAFEGFISGKILVEGLRRAGRGLNTESLIASLEGIRDLDLGLGAAVAFGPEDHQGSHKVWGTLLQPDGSYKSLKLE